ncbi:MAG: PilN domain-containing protein [Phycisphaerales bacterium]
MKSPFGRPDSAGSFLPQDYVAGKAERRATLTLLAIFTVVMVAIVSAFMVTSQQWTEVRRQQRLIDASYAEEQVKIAQLRELEEQRASLVDKAEITTALIDRVPRSVLLAEIVTRMPARVTLLEVNLESRRIRATIPTPTNNPAQGRAGGSVRSLRGGATTGRGGRGQPEAPARPRIEPPRFESTLTLVGVASANNDIADFLQELKRCPLLEEVDLQYIQATVIDTADRRKFEIHARLRPDADATLVAMAQPTRLNGMPTPAEMRDMVGGGAGTTVPAPPAGGGASPGTGTAPGTGPAPVQAQAPGSSGTPTSPAEPDKPGAVADVPESPASSGGGER